MAGSIATAIWPLYFVLALGFFAGKRHSFPADAARELNKLAMTFALPALLFVSTAALSKKTLAQEVPALATLLIAYLSIFSVAVTVIHRRFKRSWPEAAIAGICSASPAGPLFGPAVLPALFGTGGLTAVTVAALVLNVAQNPVAFALLGRGKSSAQSKHTTPLGAVLNVVKEPVVWAPLAGLACALVGLNVPKIAGAGFMLIGSTASGVAIFAAGLTLAASGFRFSAEIAVEAALKMIVQPALVLLLGFLFGLRGDLLAECVVVSALSSGLLGTMLASTKGVYTQQSASVTMLTSVSLIVFLPLWIWISKVVGG